MDELQAIKDQAQDALSDLPQAGAIGLAAILAGARFHERLGALSSDPADLEALREAARELEQLEALVESHPGALSQALGRLVTVAAAAAAKVGRLGGPGA